MGGGEEAAKGPQSKFGDQHQLVEMEASITAYCRVGAKPHSPARGWQEKKLGGGRGESGGREVAGRAARPAAADRWSVNKLGGPTLPRPRACRRTEKAHDGSAAAAHPAPLASRCLPSPATPPQGARAGGPGEPAAWAPPESEGPSRPQRGPRGPAVGRPTVARLPGGGGSSSSCSFSPSDAQRPAAAAAAATPRAARGDEPSPAPLRLPPCRHPSRCCRLRPLPSVRTWSPRASAQLRTTGRGWGKREQGGREQARRRGALRGKRGESGGGIGLRRCGS